MMIIENRSLASYESKKKILINQLTAFTQQNTPIRLGKETSNLFRHRPTAKRTVDVRHFNEVISIDKEKLEADVEGMTSYETLVAACLKFNCMPTVVPELKTITVGGALTGGGIESSSFKYGLVHETMLEYEVLLSDGRIVLCQPDNEHRDLFYGFPNTYGTLGYALRIKVKLRPIKPYVKLSYLHFTEPKSFFTTMNKLCREKRDHDTVNFIDGVIFKPNDMVICMGEFVDNAPYTHDYTFMNIFYHSIQNRKEDYLSTLDYIWRWDTDWFWCSKFFGVQNPLLRFLVGKKRLNSKTYWKIRRFFGNNLMAKKIRDLVSKKTEAVIQDVQLPIENAEAFYQFFQKNIGIEPIWLCPTRSYQTNAVYDFYPLQPDTLYVNFGFWDVVSFKEEGYYNRLIEKQVSELQGKKSLYSDVYYTEEVFWSIFNKAVYGQLKQRYDAQHHFLSLYQKCVER